MPKRQPSFIIQLQAEGTTTERRLEKEIINREARKLAVSMPTNPAQRQVYVGSLLWNALNNKINRDVFMRFVQLTNTYLEVKAAEPGARMLKERRK